MQQPKIQFHICCSIGQLEAPLKLKTDKVPFLQWAAAFFGLIFGACMLCSAIWARLDKFDPVSKEAVMIDAGSSHTSFFIYQWVEPIDTKAIHECYGEYGLDEFKDNIAGIKEAIIPCLEQVRGVLSTTGINRETSTRYSMVT